MAVVYRGIDRQLKRVVAIKVLHRHLADYQEARDRFEREAQAVAKLRHENILEIFDYSGADEAEAAGGSYIVTEFIDGDTLKQRVTDRPISFRTDVFAIGIVLYQLTVGKPPFEGKNPHEVLKRIAECRFVDPRQANPRIGNRLGRIILRAMAAAPGDRFPAVSEMVIALEGYLDESGIAHDKVAGELGRYFQGPTAYEQALRDR